jgi:hypothetical protein
MVSDCSGVVSDVLNMFVWCVLTPPMSIPDDGSNMFEKFNFPWGRSSFALFEAQ